MSDGNENDSFVPTTGRVQGIGGITGKMLALSIIGGALYAVTKLVDLVTDDVGAGSRSL